MIIIVDSREFKSRVVRELFKSGVKIQSMKLMIGDYLIGEKICVERKSVKDFVDSLVDKRIFEQLRKMKEYYEKPVLIIEGEKDWYGVRKVHPNAIRGLLSSIAVDYEIPIIKSKNDYDTSQIIKSLGERMEKKPKPFIKKDKPVLMKDVQESILSMIPGVGVKSAKNLLKTFKTLKKISNSSIEELCSVEGIGEKIGKEIHKAFNKRYEE